MSNPQIQHSFLYTKAKCYKTYKDRIYFNHKSISFFISLPLSLDMIGSCND